MPGPEFGGAVTGVEHGFGEGEDDAGQGEQAHQQDEPMADAVPGPAFLSDLPEKGGLRELDLAVPAKAEQVDQHRQGQRGKRPEDLGVDELHRECEFSPDSPHARPQCHWPPLRFVAAPLPYGSRSGRNGSTRRPTGSSARISSRTIRWAFPMDSDAGCAPWPAFAATLAWGNRKSILRSCGLARSDGRCPGGLHPECR